jgi:hypothetical protein
MDIIVMLYLGGDVKRNDVGGVDFENMQELSILFSCRPTFSGIVDKVKEKLRWMGMLWISLYKGSLILGVTVRTLGG